MFFVVQCLVSSELGNFSFALTFASVCQLPLAVCFVVNVVGVSGSSESVCALVNIGCI